MRIRELL